MSKTEYIRARIEPNLKHGAEHVFKELGLTTTEAITLFYKQVTARKGLPFSLKIPNYLTRKAFKEARSLNDSKSFTSVEELLKDLDK